jgi:hypothetical protein
MDPKILTVYKPPHPKIRLGRDRDGGYVICDLDEDYDLLLSAGLADEVSFEEDWLKRYPGKECIAFDGTIYRCPSENPRLTWNRKNVATNNSESSDDLSSVLEGKRSVFLKMDIEGHEIDWILHSSHMDSISQMVVEFHYQPFGPNHEKAFMKINQTHVLVHIHGNNFSGTVVHEGVLFPVSFECTYVNKKFLQNPVPNLEPLPCPQDVPNNGGTDINLNHPPFVNSTSA